MEPSKVTAELEVDLDTEDIKKGVAEALEKANKEVMDALEKANKYVFDTLEKTNKDVEDALAQSIAAKRIKDGVVSVGVSQVEAEERKDANEKIAQMPPPETCDQECPSSGVSAATQASVAVTATTQVSLKERISSHLEIVEDVPTKTTAESVANEITEADDEVRKDDKHEEDNKEDDEDRKVGLSKQENKETPSEGVTKNKENANMKGKGKGEGALETGKTLMNKQQEKQKKKVPKVKNSFDKKPRLQSKK